MRNANAWTLLRLVLLSLVLSALTHNTAQYVRIGLITAVYIHLHVRGVRPQVGPTALLHCIKELVAFLVILLTCSLKVSMLARVTPRSLTLGDRSIVFPHPDRAEGLLSVSCDHNDFGFHGADTKAFSFAPLFNSV